MSDNLLSNHLYIKNLEATCKKLNDKSDKLNQIIALLNSKLSNMNLGIEHWLVDYPLEEAETQYEGDEGQVKTWQKRILLGYCEIRSEWQLAIQCTKNGDEPENSIEHEVYKNIDGPWPPRPLVSASRKLRIAALEKLPELLQALQSRAENMLRTIEEAEQEAKPTKRAKK